MVQIQIRRKSKIIGIFGNGGVYHSSFQIRQDFSPAAKWAFFTKPCMVVNTIVFAIL